MPGTLKAARIVLYLGTVFSLMILVGAIAAGADAVTLGRVFWSAWPGLLGFVVALRLSSGKRAWWITSLVVVGFWLLGALGSMGRGDPRGITGLLLPITVAVLMLLPASRAFFAKRAPASPPAPRPSQ